MCDRREKKLREKARQIYMNFGTVQHILTDILGMSKVSARWVPRMLTKDQKKSRLGISKYFLSLYEGHAEKFMRRVVCDPRWNFGPQKAQYAMEAPWLIPPKKFKRVSSAGKVIVSLFRDSHGVIMVDYLEEGRTINDAYYAAKLRRLQQEIVKNRSGNLTRDILF